MSAALAIWGERSSADLISSDSDWEPVESEDQLTKRELRTFLKGEIELWNPDLIIVYERKGTAILRALIECAADPLVWPWDKVVSHRSLDQIPDEALRGKRILIFDDMVRTGEHLRKVLVALGQRKLFDASFSNVRLAAFAVHAECSSRQIEGRWLDAWFYRDLTARAYANVRERIIRLLQSSGSLMLDTEHIEVRVQLKGGFNRFLDALRRKADPVEFRSGGERTNITVYYGDDPAHTLPPGRFPEETGFTNIVKKCRIVERDKPDEFAIIPICLPAILTQTAPWTPLQEDLLMLGSGIENSSATYAQFYGVALLASLYPLEWILRDLYAADPQAFLLSLPQRSSEQRLGSGYTLEHLKVMYPALNIDILVDQISTVVDKAEVDGKKLSRMKQERRPPITFSNADLHKSAMKLLQVIRYELDVRSEDSDNLMQTADGLRASEVFDLGKRLGFEHARISTLFDILIDDAKLVTRVAKTFDQYGRERWTRTFKPDGEVVSDLVRKFTAQWGLPNGF